MASENRVGPAQFETLPFTNTLAATTRPKGTLFALSGNRVGFNLEAIGTAGADRSTTFPGGPGGAVCISSEDCVLDKNTAAGNSFALHDPVFFDAVVAANGVVDEGQATTSTNEIALALEAVTTGGATVRVASFRGATENKFIA